MLICSYINWLTIMRKIFQMKNVGLLEALQAAVSDGCFLLLQQLVLLWKPSIVVPFHVSTLVWSLHSRWSTNSAFLTELLV